jgi:hypothetical protein
MKVRVDEMKQRSNGNSPQPVDVSGESTTDSEPKFPLLLLQTHAPCQQLQLLHKQIKTKFMQILTIMFRPVPSHPEFYFCTPNWEKNQLVSFVSVLTANLSLITAHLKVIQVVVAITLKNQ